MIENTSSNNHVCDEQLVSDYIDNRMTPLEKQEYVKKIEECISKRKCNHCKQLIIDFLSIKKNCTQLLTEYTMPKNLENNLINRIRESFQNSRIK